MSTKVLRLNRQEISLILKNGQRQSGSALGLIYRLQPQAKASRLAVVVSSKIMRLATGRQLLKRRLRQACLVLAPRFRHPVDLVVISYPPAKQQDFPQLSASLETLFRQAKLLS